MTFTLSIAIAVSVWSMQGIFSKTEQPDLVFKSTPWCVTIRCWNKLVAKCRQIKTTVKSCEELVRHLVMSLHHICSFAKLPVLFVSFFHFVPVHDCLLKLFLWQLVRDYEAAAAAASWVTWLLPVSESFLFPVSVNHVPRWAGKIRTEPKHETGSKNHNNELDETIS